MPTEKQVRIGISPQLTLEAAILRRGGFAGIAAGASVGELVYVSLKGGEPAGEEEPIEFKDGRRRHSTPSARSPSSQSRSQHGSRTSEQPYLPLVLSDVEEPLRRPTTISRASRNGRSAASDDEAEADE